LLHASEVNRRSSCVVPTRGVCGNCPIGRMVSPLTEAEYITLKSLDITDLPARFSCN
jgi:hypothetical protein